MGASENVYGKMVSDLQSNIIVGDGTITGTLNYVTGYTGFDGSNAEEQEGNYLALQFVCDPWPDSVSVELVGGTKGPVSLSEEDDFCVFKVDNTTQSIKVSASDGDNTSEKTYTLSGLTLSPKTE